MDLVTRVLGHVADFGQHGFLLFWVDLVHALLNSSTALRVVEELGIRKADLTHLLGWTVGFSEGVFFVEFGYQEVKFLISG